MVELLPERPCYVLGIVARRSLWRLRDRKKEIALRDRIAQEVGGAVPLYVFLLVDQIKSLRAVLDGMPAARLL